MQQIKKVLLSSVLFFSFMFPGLYAGEVSEDPRIISTDELLLVLADDICKIDMAFKDIHKNCSDKNRVKKSSACGHQYIKELKTSLIMLLDRLAEDNGKLTTPEDQSDNCPGLG
jgi:hypothetical protein